MNEQEAKANRAAIVAMIVEGAQAGSEFYIKLLSTLDPDETGHAIAPGFANMYGYSDVEPYEVIRAISSKTIEVRRMTATLSPDWKPEINAGGFAGHCSNQQSQVWIYAVDESAPVIRARLRKDGYFHSTYGQHRLAKAPRKFHDYNF
jgi:hypothetical protein